MVRTVAIPEKIILRKSDFARKCSVLFERNAGWRESVNLAPDGPENKDA